MPVFRDRTSRTDFFNLSDESTQFQFSRATDKFGTGFAIDGVGDLKPPFVPDLLITVDNVPDSADTSGNTNPTITVTAPGEAIADIISTIDTIGDQDFYKVTLTAGTAYEFGLYSYNGGPNGAGLTDPYLELYAPDGTTLLVSADGGADTVYNQANSGFDVLLVYTPTVSGTFFVDARAFSNSPATPNGDSVGDYQLFVREQDVNDPNVYHPYYEPTEPLYAIDWGTQVNKVNQSARNPDGNEGTRNTGNAQGTPEFSSSVDIAGLAAAQGVDTTGKNVITVYFAKAGDVFVSNDPSNPGLPPATITAVAPQDFERLAVWTSLAEFAKVADIVYIEVQDRDQADFIYTSYQGTPGPGVSLLGSMSPPDESDEGLAQFNSGDYRWNATDLQQGGFSFTTLIHEFGHGHGLAHPHDNGGHSGIMNGVEPEGAGVADYTTGDYDLNQGVFTMMSYEDGWQTSPHNPHNAPTSGGYGYLGSLMAFDIAAIQDKYGVNEDYNIGNNIYTMKDVNAAGTYYTSIWDAGGIDAIVYSGARNSNIDLRAASLQYEYGGGGWVSYALGIYGGFTIANGVTIENATTGSGNDTLIGNVVNNILNGGAGVDAMTGGAGNDIYVVDNAGDTAVEIVGQGYDQIFSSVSYTLAVGTDVEVLSTSVWEATTAINLTGNGINNQIWGNAGANVIDGRGGADEMLGLGGDDCYVVDNAADIVVELSGKGFDVVFSSVNYTLSAIYEVEGLSTRFWEDTTAINLTANGLANTLWGNAGSNVLDGGGGADSMLGLGGDDYYIIDNAADAIAETAGNGNDVALTSVSYTLGATAQVEALSARFWEDTTAISLTGNGFSNYLIGNAGANTLNGRGGSDSLRGNGGADTFAFTDALVAGNIDHILDFASGTDKIALDDAVFTGLAPGALPAGAFVAGTTALDSNDRILYDQASGAIFYDADGNGSGGAILFATVQAGAVLTASDFQVI